jgi:DNA-binding HxlR family transcriptional regulator
MVKNFKPGNPTKSSKTGRPICVLLELLSQPWTLRILWELKEKPLKFAQLRTECENISPTSLNKRLAELREAQIIEHKKNEGYLFTARGKQLLNALSALNKFADKWKDDF